MINYFSKLIDFQIPKCIAEGLNAEDIEDIVNPGYFDGLHDMANTILCHPFKGLKLQFRSPGYYSSNIAYPMPQIGDDALYMKMLFLDKRGDYAIESWRDLEKISEQDVYLKVDYAHRFNPNYTIRIKYIYNQLKAQYVDISALYQTARSSTAFTVFTSPHSYVEFLMEWLYTMPGNVTIGIESYVWQFNPTDDVNVGIRHKSDISCTALTYGARGILFTYSRNLTDNVECAIEFEKSAALSSYYLMFGVKHNFPKFDVKIRYGINDLMGIWLVIDKRFSYFPFTVGLNFSYAHTIREFGFGLNLDFE